MFGLELRKKNSVNIKSLYNDVDKVLRAYNIPQGSVSQETQISTVAHALQKMISTQNYFDVCTIERCAKICQIVIPVERQRVYSAIHCMHWSEMTEDYRKSIVAMVLDDFRTVLNPEEEFTEAQIV